MKNKSFQRQPFINQESAKYYFLIKIIDLRFVFEKFL